MLRRLLATTSVLTALASCATTTLPPVAVIATRPDAMNMAGNWEGEYASTETQRSGTIQFFLSADPDSAAGEVLMFPRHARSPEAIRSAASAAAQGPQHLSIRLVMASGDSIMGVLTPYEDENGSALLTRFFGVLKEDTMQGSYSTENLRTQEITGGEWSARRKR